tara:strand:- start:53 stop:490 length:438 start_codon:yes stop_codon:yes gene_type:complete
MDSPRYITGRDERLKEIMSKVEKELEICRGTNDAMWNDFLEEELGKEIYVSGEGFQFNPKEKIKELEAEVEELKEFKFCVKDIMDCGYEDSDSLVLNNLETREEVYEDYWRSNLKEENEGLKQQVSSLVKEIGKIHEPVRPEPDG